MKITQITEGFGSAEEYKKLDKSADLDENRLLKTNKLSSAEYQKAKKLKAFNPSDYTWNPDEQLYVKKANQIDEEARDAIRDFMGMGMSRAQAEAEARKMYPDEFEQPARSYSRPQRSNTKPVLTAYHFFNVPEDQAEEAKRMGLKQTKSGKWYKGEYNTSGAIRFDATLKSLARKFGDPKRWEPKKKTSEGEQHGNSKVYDKCWSGYKKVPGKKRGEKGSCVKETDVEEGVVGKVLGAAALIASLWGVNNQLAQQAYDSSPQLQKLTAYLEVAKQHKDQRMIDQLQKRISNHKTRLDLGKGDVMGADGNPADIQYDKQ